ncbi:MAG: polymorphic toxin-type HINT domain-containing protein, partial [Leptospirales bacterium]
SFIIDGSGATKLAQTADLFDAAFDANQALTDFEANKEAYQESVHGATVAAQTKIQEQNALVEEMHARAMKHTQMQVEMAQQAASLAQALITGGTLQSWVEGQMRSNVAGMIEDATGFPAGFISGLLGGMSPGDAAKSYAEGLMMSQLDKALGLPPGSMSFLVGEQKKKSAAKSSPTAKLANNMASMGTVMGTIGGMAAGFLTGGPLGMMAGGVSGFAASKAMEPAMNTFYEKNPMAMDAAAFATTAMTGNPAVWYSYQGAKGYHNGGTVGAVTAMADTALMAVSYVTPLDVSVGYTYEGGYSTSVGVGVKGVASVGVNYSDVNGVGANLSVGEAVGLGLSVGASQYGGNTIGLKAGFGFGDNNALGVLSAGLSYNSITGAGTNVGFSKGLTDPGKSGLGVSGNVGLNWNETNGFGASLGASLTHNPTQESEYGDPSMGARSSPLSGTGLGFSISEGEGLSLSANMGSATIGSFNFNTGDFAYNENFANDAGRGALRSEYDRQQTVELLAELDRAVVDNRDKMTDAEWEAYEKGELSPDDKAKILKRIHGEKGLANVSTDDSSFGDGLLEDFLGKFVMLGETIAGNNSGKQGYIDESGEFHLRTCFVAGTLVRVKEGTGHDGGNYKRIEDISAGDLVLSWDERSARMDFQPVQLKFERQAYTIYTLSFSDGTQIETTWNHRFYLHGIGWREAKDLKDGDAIESANSGSVKIRSITKERRTETVYNFSVTEFSTYYVT